MSRLSARSVGLTVGLAIGLALALVYTWLVEPVELVNTYPALLRVDHRQDWIRLVALSHAADSDIERSRSRLEGLDREEVAAAVSAVIEEYASAGYPAETLRRLTALAEALGVHTPAMLVYLRTPTRPPSPTHTPSPTNTPSPTRTPSPTNTPSPTPTSTPTRTPTPYVVSPLSTPTATPTPTPLPPTATAPPGPPFRVTLQEQVCEAGQRPRIEVIVKDEDGEELPGVEIWLMWASGADRAISGLKPSDGVGYVDFEAEAGVSYTLGIGELGVPLVTDLQIDRCPREHGREPLLGSWRVVVEKQPVAIE